MNAFPIRSSRQPHPAPLGISFEFFPPKNEAMAESLWACVQRLAPLAPRFVSVTYGAGGSTRERTHQTVKRILDETALKPAAHLTCVAATKAETDEIIRGYWETGVRHIVALRGDPVTGLGTPFEAHPEGYQSSVDLVAGIKAIGDFEVAVSAYPEKHPDSPSIEEEIDLLKRKVDAGATRAITQFFFDNDHYFRYLDRVRKAGINIEIVPGILPVQNFKTAASFATRCGTDVPGWLAKRFEGLDDDAETRRLVAAAVAVEQVYDLLDRGVSEFHFYTMNKADLVFAICHMLGMRAVPAGLAA
ncbi:MAG: methylenetetrahydrofolate reductase [NAD(P)H] [Beijerinckiaceae bacterium]|nr:methylenetetrahydrofolate reductase [NAD(P)H] [Beijerinckiaceae bacterium]MCZ8301159.1 methylenetetrahydrofolate reductase [NAD(P)H] [Beijerinckiaceae bacterium]